MALRSTWKGYLKLSLVSVPLKAYSAGSGSSGPSISLNQLHDKCHSRIQYRKVCPIHGEVPKEEIVSGYEYAKGQYAIVDPDEVEKLRAEGDKSITIDAFLPNDAIDPLYYSGTSYYLIPDGPVGQKPYALIRQAMAEESRHAIGRAVISGKEKVVLLRPVENVLSMSVLQYEPQVKQPSAFEDELVKVDSSKEELKLTKSLIEALSRDDASLSDYKDEYTDKMTQLIEAKVQGKELVSPPAAEEPQIINLMDALKESVSRVKKPEAKKPEKKMAESAKTRTKKAAATKKRKSG
jgi:DNA end-binding protein Ku